MFNKGSPVHIIGSYNFQAQIFVRRAVVHSCGEKQMVLVDQATGKAIGCHFQPRQQQTEYRRVLANLTDVQAECVAEAMCDEVRLAEIERCERAISAYQRRCPSHDDSYVLAMKREIEAIRADQPLVRWN